MGQTEAQEKVTLQEAARILGMSEGAVRKRVKRGTLSHEKDKDGRIYIYLDARVDEGIDGGADDRVDGVPHPNTTTLISELQARVEFLEDELDDWKRIVATRDQELETRAEELRRKDMFIAQLHQTMGELTKRIPELEPTRETAPEPSESPLDASEESARGETTPDTERRSWWRRMLKDWT